MLRPSYCEVTSTWTAALPKSTLTVTGVPDAQKEGDVPVVRGPLSRKEVWAPGARVKVFVWKVRGLFAARVPLGPPTDQVAAPPEVTLQGDWQAGAVDPPVFVPVNIT